MPHTSRQQSRKKGKTQPQKRTTVTDDNGWTHVTTGGNLKRALKSTTATDREQFGTESQPQQPQPEIQQQLQLRPAEAPTGLNVDGLKRQFLGYREKWDNSTACEVVRGVLRRAVDAALSSGQSSSSSSSSRDDGGGIKIICLGLGSPSGFLRDGWVDRRNVSMYQLAALTSIIDFYNSVSHKNNNNNNNPKVYAQDPVFNTLDKSLLHSLGIAVLEHPAAFDLVSGQRDNDPTFLYCPGAERAHIEQLLSLSSSTTPSHHLSPVQGPALLFANSLEEYGDDSEVVRAFLDARESVRLPAFGPCEHAFWGMRVYYIG